MRRKLEEVWSFTVEIGSLANPILGISEEIVEKMSIGWRQGQ